MTNPAAAAGEPDPHTTAGKLADLERRRSEAVHAGSAAGGGQAARAGQADRAGADRHAAGPRLLHRVRRAGPAPRHRLRHRGHPALRGRRGHRVRHRGRAAGVRVQPGLHGVRRLAGRGLRREDRQDHGPRAEDRLPDHRDQRRRGRTHTGGRGSPGPVRRDLLPQRDGLRGRPADLADHGPVRGRRGLLPRDHRLHPHGRGHQPHVHHRARRDQDRDRGGRDVRGSRRRHRARGQVRRGPLPGGRRAGLHRLRRGPALLPALEQPRGAAPDSTSDAGPGDRADRRRTRHAHPGFARTSPTTCTT